MTRSVNSPIGYTYPEEDMESSNSNTVKRLFSELSINATSEL